MTLHLRDIDLAAVIRAADEPWTFQSLADVMRISPSQAHASWKRLCEAKLASEATRSVIERNLDEFLEHGAKYYFLEGK